MASAAGTAYSPAPDNLCGMFPSAFQILSADNPFLFPVHLPIFCVSLELLIKHLLGLPYRITWSAVVLTVCVIIDFALVTILAKKRLRNEVRRRLHF